MTVIWYCLSQIYETQWVWDTKKQPKIHYSGAFITGKKRFHTIIVDFIAYNLKGIYGMLNIYVFAVLVLFSPVISNVDDMDELSKHRSIFHQLIVVLLFSSLALTNDDGNMIHLTNNQTSAYQMISKAAIS